MADPVASGCHNPLPASRLPGFRHLCVNILTIFVTYFILGADSSFARAGAVSRLPIPGGDRFAAHTSRRVLTIPSELIGREKVVGL